MNQPYRNPNDNQGWNNQGYGFGDRKQSQQGQHAQAPYGAQPGYGPGIEVGQAQPEQGWMDENGAYTGALDHEGVVAFTKRVYGWFAAALTVATGTCLAGAAVITGTAQQVANLDGTTTAQASSAAMMLSGVSVLVFFISYIISIFARRGDSPLKKGLLFTMAGSAGMMASALVGTLVSAGMATTVVMAFGITCVTFFGLTVYVLTSGKDFRSLGGLLLVGCLALIGLVLLNIFGNFGTMMERGITSFGVLLFIGFILFDTSMVTRNYYWRNDAVGAAIELFYDFFALFRYVLILLMRRD